MRVDTGVDKDNQTGIHGDINRLTRKKREFDKLTWGIDEIIKILNHLGFGIFEFFFVESLHQGGFSATNFSDQGHPFSITCHLLRVGYFRNIKS